VFDGEELPLARIVEALARVGYRALPLDRDALDDTRRRETRDAQKRLAVAGLGAMQAMMYASALWFGAFDGADAVTRDLLRWLTLLATIPVVAYSAAPFFTGALRLLAARRLGMDVPVALAIALICAGSFGEMLTGGRDIWFDAVGMFVFFLSAGRYLEMRARHRAGDLSDALARLTPAVADRVQADGTLLRVGAFELAPGDLVLVADGGGVPADGLLESGECRVAPQAPGRRAVRRQHRRRGARNPARDTRGRRYRGCRDRGADGAGGEREAAAGARRRARRGRLRRAAARGCLLHGGRLGDPRA
jgi:Cu2+-exporting ATPase